MLGFGEDQINLFRNVATNEELGVDTAPIRALVSQVAEIKLEIVRIVAAKMDLSHGSNAALAEIVDALLQGHLASKNMLALMLPYVREISSSLQEQCTVEPPPPFPCQCRSPAE